MKYGQELGANCVFVDYEAAGAAVALTNSVQLLGRRVDVRGFAVPSPSEAGVFDVKLGPGAWAPRAPHRFERANYVVAALGPKYLGKYEYAVVTDPSKSTLYILVRDTKRFAAYEQAVLQTVAELGFTSFMNRPRKTNQERCSYASETTQWV